MPSSARRERLNALGLVALLALAAVGLAVVGGPPRLPGGLPRPEQISALLSGASLPVEPFVPLLLDLAWLMWTWIVGSLAIELLLVAAESAARGAAWVRSLRAVADRVSFPLARRAVAAAFAVQLLSRVPLAAAQPLPAVETVLVDNSDYAASFIAYRPPDAATLGNYVVRPGDTLWSIADQAYGSGAAYRRLIEANVGRRMPNGQVFTRQGVIQPGWDLVVPDARLHVEDVDGTLWYTVRPGDTLSAVADAVMGDAAQWRELFELNRGALSPDGRHALSNPNLIWPGLRLRLPADPTAPVEDADPDEADLVAASAAPQPAAVEPLPAPVEPPPAPPGDEPSTLMPLAEIEPDAEIDAEPPPLLRTSHARDPIALEAADTDVGVPDSSASSSGGDVSLPSLPSNDVPTTSLALGGAGLAALAGLALGAQRVRRRRRLPREPESEVVVEGGFAEAELAHAFTRGMHGLGDDPLADTVIRLQQLLDEYNLTDVGLVAAYHGRSATTVTLAAGLVEQTLLVDLAPAIAERLDVDVESWISSDQDVVLRLVKLRKARALPAAGVSSTDAPCLIPLGVLYDRQVFSAALNSLGHVLVASLPGHGADTILTSLLATLTARQSPQQLRVWLIAHPRALPAPLFDLPHLEKTVDATDPQAVAQVVEALRTELDERVRARPAADLVVVLPELSHVGEQAANWEMLASRAAKLGVRFIAATNSFDDAALSPLLLHFDTRMVLRMQDEEASVALLGVADAAFLGGGGRLLLRLDGREPVELYGYQVAAEHLERLVRVMRSAYAPRPDPPAAPPWPTSPLEVPRSADIDPVAPETIEASPQAIDPSTETAIAAGPPIEVMCFGGPRVLCAGQQVWPRAPGGEVKPWEFLLYLACQPAEGVSSEDAVEALWPEDEEAENAPHRFRQLRYRLRHMLVDVPGAPETDGICLDRRGTLRLDPGIVHSDAQEFLELVRKARISPGVSAIEHLERARALYVGDLLDGRDARRYTWLDERDDSGVTLREHFRRLFEHASARLAELYASSGQVDAALELFRELTELDPGDERLWRALFRLHAGRRDASALEREEHRMRAALRDLAAEVEGTPTPQLEEPSSETVQEYQRLLAGVRDSERQPAVV
jgi:nucleoid-associated protein YgaU/DNA-binding SARP family transcriptional activator